MRKSTARPGGNNTDEVRLARYRGKMRYVLENMTDAVVLAKKSGRYEEKALYYCLLTAIECAMDILAMMLRDSGLVPAGDKHNIETLKREDILTDALAKELSLCNGMRNVLAHQYNGIDRETVLGSVKNIDRAMRDLITVLEGWLTGH